MIIFINRPSCFRSCRQIDPSMHASLKKDACSVQETISAREVCANERSGAAAARSHYSFGGAVAIWRFSCHARELGLASVHHLSLAFNFKLSSS